MRRLVFGLLCVALGLSGIVGCSQKDDSKTTKKDFASRPEVKADDLIGNSFAVVETLSASAQGLGNELQTTDRARITIQKSALEKEFLLQASNIPQLPAATGNALKSRVVAFRLRGENVYLMEATQGHSVSNDLPQTLLLAEFPVVFQDDSSIQIDFNTGMSNLLVFGDWHGQDFSGSQPSPDDQFRSVPVNMSYIESAELTSRNQLYIRQTVQANMDGTNRALEIRYWLQPYRPDSKFVPFISRDMNQFGFFEVAPQFSATGQSTIFATKFNHREPISFAISDNTPAEYKQAVRDGILYWNAAFGSEVIKVVEAPAGATAPDSDYNIVQWVKWDTAGFAYADAHADPRTGQTLRAQVFMTSVFGMSGKDSAAAILRELESQNQEHQKGQFSLRGFTMPSLCDLDINERYAEAFRELLESDTSDAKILKAAQDYVRDTIAHEVGHTLGLRHNFAGSVAMNFNLRELSDHMRTYFETGRAPENIVVSNSVMDYLLIKESFLSGDQVAQGKILDYDRAAIRRLYLSEKFPIESSPIFCTDSHVGVFADCERFDSGANVIVQAQSETQSVYRSTARRLVNSYLAAKKATNDGARVVTSRESISAFASRIVNVRKQLLQAMSKNGQLIRHRFNTNWVDGAQSASLRTVELDDLRNLLSTAGWDNVWPTSMTQHADSLKEAVSEYLRITKVHVIDGTKMTLSSTEEREIKSMMDALRNVWIEDFAESELLLLTQYSWPDHPIADGVSQQLTKFVNHILLTENASVPEIGEVANDVLPIWMFSFNQRTRAPGLLNAENGSAIDWAYSERAKLSADMSQLIERIFGDKPNVETMSRPQRRFYLENKRILDSI